MTAATISWKRRIAAFLLALLLCAVCGSLVQTGYNLADLVALGLDIPAALRGQTYWHDLHSFAPLYAAICAVGLLPAFVVAGVIARGARGRAVWYALAGGTAVWAALASANLLAGMPVLVFATRHAGGLAGLIAGGILAGLVYAALTRPRTRGIAGYRQRLR